MTGKSLTDELNSVLREHALEAPHAVDTIDAVLARTVAGGRSGTGRWGLGTSRRRLAWTVAGTAAAVVVGAGLFGSSLVGSGSQKNSASSTASGGTGVSDGTQLPEAARGPQAGTDNGLAAASSIPAGGPGPVFSLPSPRCASGKAAGGLLSDLGPDPTTGRRLYVGSESCAPTGPTLDGTTVRVYRANGSGTPAVIATLLDSNQAVRADHVTLDRAAHRLSVVGTSYAAGPGADRGAERSYTYAISADYRTFTPVGSQTILSACVADQLHPFTEIHPEANRVAFIQLTNTSRTTCVLQGYPAVTVRTENGKRAGAAYSATTADQAAAARLVEIQPGTSVSVELTASPDQGCGTSATVSLQLPSQTTVDLDYPINLCGLEAHPFS